MKIKAILGVFLISALLLTVPLMGQQLDVSKIYSEAITPLNDQIFNLRMQILQLKDQLTQANQKNAQLEAEIKKLKEQ